MNEIFETSSLRPDDCDAHLPAINEPDRSGTDDRGQTATLGRRSRRLSGLRFHNSRCIRRVGWLTLAAMSILAAGCGSSDGGVASPGQVSSSSAGTPVVVTGGDRSCAIDTDRSIQCWGATGPDVPAGEFSAITIGSRRPCAIRTDGTLVCWAQNEGRHMPPSGKFMAVASAKIHSCALSTDGSPACWGDTRGGEGLPQGKYKAIVAAGSMTCGIRTDSTVVCQEEQQVTHEIPDEFVAIAYGGGDLCGIRADKTAACYKTWNAEPSDFSLPAEKISAISLAGNYGCAIRAEDRSIGCWTTSDWGDQDGEATPPIGEFVSISTASDHACGVRTDKKIICWGSNTQGKATPPQTLSG